MKYVTLHGTGLTPSLMGFGCASIMGGIGKRQALRALETAYDVGITHYDVARSYGYGEAETVLGSFIKGKREGICLATKFGIRPSKASFLLRAVKPLARKSIVLFPGLKKRIRRQSQSWMSGGHFSVAMARESLEESLRALKTEYIDIYFLHECTEHDELSDELFHFLDNCVRDGKIRYYGLATRADSIDKILTRRPANKISILQFISNIFTPASFENRSAVEKAFIVHSPFGGQNGLSRIHQILQNNVVAKNDLERTLGINFSNRQVVSQILLSYAMFQANGGVVLCSMFNENHIRENARLAEFAPFTNEQVNAFVRYINTHGRPDGSSHGKRSHDE